jgi:hypothetical protein
MEKGSRPETGFFVWKVIPMCPEKNKNKNWGMMGEDSTIHNHYQ